MKANPKYKLGVYCTTNDVKTALTTQLRGMQSNKRHLVQFQVRLMISTIVHQQFVV